MRNKKSSQIDVLRDVLDKLEGSDIKNEHHFDYVDIITAQDLMDFLCVDGYFKTIHEQINYLAFNLFDNNFLKKFTLDVWKYSREHLASVRGEQLLGVL